MEKAKAVLLRMSIDHNAEIQAAAESLGQSVTTFLTDAALKQARQVKKRPKKRPSSRGVHGGVPSFFRACCFEAANGGGGYSVPGWHLANALGSQIPYDLEVDEWQAEIKTLRDLLANENGEEVWTWFKRHFPKCMALVPTRRREQFVAGVQGAYEEGRVEL